MSEPERFWFPRKSWQYLGCDHGTGRWRARGEFLRGLIPAWWRFHRSMRGDRP